MTQRTTVVRDDVVDRPLDVQAAAAGAIARDPISWGPIWAGVLTAFGLFILFSLIALAAGLALVNFEGGGGGAIDVPRPDLVASLVTGAFIVLAFFAGGFTASWSAGLIEESRGILNGFLVWALALALLMLLAAMGLSSALGAVGEMFGPTFAPGSLPDADPQQLTEAFQAAAWQTVFAIVLSMVAAVLGGLVGTREEVRRDWYPYKR